MVLTLWGIRVKQAAAVSTGLLQARKGFSGGKFYMLLQPGGCVTSDTVRVVTSPGIRAVIMICAGLMVCAMIGLVIGGVFFAHPYF